MGQLQDRIGPGRKRTKAMQQARYPIHPTDGLLRRNGQIRRSHGAYQDQTRRGVVRHTTDVFSYQADDHRQGIKKSEEARKQRDLKKYGKQIQHEKLKQREMEKKGFQDKIQGIKRSKH